MATTLPTKPAVKPVLTLAQQHELDKLASVIGSEAGITAQLADIDAELLKMRTALAPIEEKRAELIAKQKQIADAKAAAVAIKTSK